MDCLTAKSSTAPISQSSFSAKQTGNYRKRLIEGDIELEAATDLGIKIYPSIGGNATLKNSAFSGGTLLCYCTDTPMIVQITSQTAHNHVWGVQQRPTHRLKTQLRLPHGLITVEARANRRPVPRLHYRTNVHLSRG